MQKEEEKTIKFHNIELNMTDLCSSFDCKVHKDHILFVKIDDQNKCDNDEPMCDNIITNIKSENIKVTYYPYIHMDILRKIHRIDSDADITVDKWLGVMVLTALCDPHAEEEQSNYSYEEGEEKTFITELAECDSYPCDTIDFLYQDMLSDNVVVTNMEVFTKIQKISSIN